MAAKKSHRRRHARRRHNPVMKSHRRVHHRRRHRRNPMGVSGIMGHVTGGLMDAAWGVGGKTAARFAVSKTGFVPGTITGLAVEAAAGVVGAMLLRRVSASGARAFLQGAFMAPIETFAITSKVPFFSDYLGDYGTMTLPMGYNAGALNPGRDTGAYVSGYPHGAALMAGYPQDGFRDDSMGDFDGPAGRFR